MFRASDIFPVRQQRFLCDDARYYQSYEDANTERNYIIISNITLYVLCSVVPIMIVRIINIYIFSLLFTFFTIESIILNVSSYCLDVNHGTSSFCYHL